MRTAAFGVFVALLTGVAGLVLWHPARVAVQALLLLPALFPTAPVDPLAAVTPAPIEDYQTYDYAGGTVDVHFVAPPGRGQHGAVVLLLGAGDLPESDLAVHFAEALARLGVVTALAESSGMAAERLSFDEIDAIRVSVHALDARADVDARRVGLIGLSASGGLSIVAAAQPDLQDAVSFVNSFGSYNDAAQLVVDVGSRTQMVDGQVRDWQPEQRTLDVVSNALADAGVGADDSAELLRGVSRARAEEIVDGFAPDAKERLAEVSPSHWLEDVRAHVYLMHDTNDPFIPFGESRNLVVAAPPGLVKRYTEFSIFEHVIPDRSVPLQTFVPDLWRLFWHVHAVLLELV